MKTKNKTDVNIREQLKTAERELETWRFMSRSEVAELAGVSVGRISQLVAEGIIAHDPGGKFPRLETTKAIAGRLRERTTLSELKRTQLEKQNRLLDYDLQSKARELLPRSEIESAWSNTLLNCRQKLLSLGNRISPRLAFCKTESEIEREINTEIDHVLLELSKFKGTAEPEPEPANPG